MSLSTFAPPDVAPGRTSQDYFGSYDEWIFNSARSLAERYAAGDQSMLDNLSGATGPIGQPAGSDFGSTQGGAATGTISSQTYNFFANYVKTYGTQDPYLTQQYGAPPSRSATYVPDPNSPGAISAANRTWETGENALDRQADLDLAGIRAQADRDVAGIHAEASKYGADKQYEGVKLQVDNNWRTAVMQDATDRYIAEGTWGVQKYVAELQETGAMDRLKLELGMRDKELAQRAIEEKNRYDVSLKGLALEVAKYDAELSASPRNWLKYASWLQSRDIVVNGLSLSMAAQEVPEESIDPSLVSTSFGAAAAMPLVFEQASGATGGATSGQNAFGTDMVNMAAPQTGQPAPLPLNQPAPSAQQVGQMSATGLANSLLGENPIAATSGEYNTGSLQGMMDSLSTQGSGQKQSTFGAWGGPTTNALGIDIGPEVSGSNVDYRKFSKMLPSQQEMKIGGVASVRGDFGVNDWVSEMDRSRPKGGATGAATYG